MRKKALFALAVFALMVSSMGFICGEDEEDPAMGRVDIWNSLLPTLTSVSYGSASWTNLNFDNTPSDYKEIPTTSERIIIVCGGTTYYSAYQAPAEDGHKYTLNIFGSNCSSMTYTIVEDE